MARNGKITRSIIRNPAYRQAFENLDIALSKNTPSNDIEKINRLRIAVFGDAVLDVIRREQSRPVEIAK